LGEVRWTKKVGPTQITKFSVGSMDNCVYLLRVGEEAAFVDGGSAEAGYVLEQVGGKKLESILQTHGHGDHTQALREVVRETGATVFAHPSDRLPVSAVPLGDGGAVYVGPVELKVLHTPGHTPGSICFLLQGAGETHLFAGDTLFPGGPGNTQGDPKRFATIMKALDEKLFTLPDDTHVYPGHGDDTTIGTERPHLEEWRARGW
jgi:glyoxylase-like metal-dependent hydrolase (beta-lactamase superfamily II)